MPTGMSSVSVQVRDNLLAIVGAYRRATGQRLSAVSRKFYGNASFLHDFRYGRQSLSLKKLDEMLDAMRQDWPEKAEWPGTGAIFMTRDGNGAGK